MTTWLIRAWSRLLCSVVGHCYPDWNTYIAGGPCSYCGRMRKP